MVNTKGIKFANTQLATLICKRAAKPRSNRTNAGPSFSAYEITAIYPVASHLRVQALPSQHST